MLLDEIGFILLFILTILLLVTITLGIELYDSSYKKPMAADKANKYCKERGYDQMKSFDRIGLLSDTPVAIKCEFSERYTDLGIRVNG